MPFIANNSTTFAFSERQNSWTTRYTFTPTCYANCGDSMLSSKDNTGIWLHDVNEDRNNFYNASSGKASEIEVSFNDLPSDVKVFNSVSVETNAKSISADFFSSDELKDTNSVGTPFSDGQTSNYGSFYISDEQEGFVDLEGIKYCPVPRNTPIPWVTPNIPDLSDSSTIYMGAISLDPELLEPDFFEEQQGFYEFKVRLSKSVESSIPVGRYNQLNLPGIVPGGPEIQIPSETNFKILAFDAGTNEDVLILNEEQTFGTPNTPSLSNSLSVVAQDGDVLTLRYERRVSYYELATPTPPFVPFELFVSNGNPVLPEIAEPFSFVLNSGDPMFLQTPQFINGEQMRSTYMRTRFNIHSQGEYVEINAINCDYDLSRNHHSLTQNS